MILSSSWSTVMTKTPPATKKFTAKPPRQTERPNHAPLTAAGNRRSFDARPKASNTDRWDGSARPAYHMDDSDADPLDAVDGES